MRLDGDFTWEESQPPALVGIDLSIKQGDLIAVVGSTGDFLDWLVLASAVLRAEVCAGVGVWVAQCASSSYLLTAMLTLPALPGVIAVSSAPPSVCAGSGKSSLLAAALGLMQQVEGEEVQLHGKVGLEHLQLELHTNFVAHALSCRAYSSPDKGASASMPLTSATLQHAVNQRRRHVKSHISPSAWKSQPGWLLEPACSRLLCSSVCLSTVSHCGNILLAIA